MPTFYEQIQALLNEGKTQEALTLFSKTGKPEAEMMQSCFDRLMQDKPEGRAEKEQWYLKHNRLHFGMLEMAQKEISTPKSLEDLQDQLQQKIEADTEETLNLLISSGDPNAIPLLARLKEAKKHYIAKDIDFRRWAEIRSTIDYEILGVKKGDQDAVKSRILQLLKERKTKEALALCEDLGEPYFLLQAQFNMVQRDWNMGLITAASLEMTHNRIQMALEEMLRPVSDQNAVGVKR